MTKILLALGALFVLQACSVKEKSSNEKKLSFSPVQSRELAYAPMDWRKASSQEAESIFWTIQNIHLNCFDHQKNQGFELKFNPVGSEDSVSVISRFQKHFFGNVENNSSELYVNKSINERWNGRFVRKNKLDHMLFHVETSGGAIPKVNEGIGLTEIISVQCKDNCKAMISCRVQ